MDVTNNLYTKQDKKCYASSLMFQLFFVLFCFYLVMQVNLELFQINYTSISYLMMNFKHNLRCPFKLLNPESFFIANVIHIIYNFFKTSH